MLVSLIITLSIPAQKARKPMSVSDRQPTYLTKNLKCDFVFSALVQTQHGESHH